MFSLLTLTVCQLSVENEMARRAADTRAQMAAKQSVLALQKAILSFEFHDGHGFTVSGDRFSDRFHSRAR